MSDDFQPPLDRILDWQNFAIFLRTTQIPDLEGILRAVPEEERLARLGVLVHGGQAAAHYFDWTQGLFWLTFLVDAQASCQAWH